MVATDNLVSPYLFSISFLSSSVRDAGVLDRGGADGLVDAADGLVDAADGLVDKGGGLVDAADGLVDKGGGVSV